MKQFEEDSKIIKFITIAGDFVILNFTLITIYTLFRFYYPEAVIYISLRTYLAIANLCYIPCISIFKIILHNRIVHPEVIITRVIYTIGTHFLLTISILGIMRMPDLARFFLFTFYIVFFLFISIWRLSLRIWVKRFRQKGKNIRPTVLIGTEGNASELYHLFSDDASYGYRLVGVFYDSTDNEEILDNANHLGNITEVIPWLEENHVNEVFCCLPAARQNEILPIVDYCENNMIRYYSVPNVRSYLKRRMKMELLADIPVLYIRDEPLLQPENRLIKRSFDLFCSSLFLCTLYPVIYIIVGSVIKFTSPGPIYFKQERSGENGGVFQCIKFRSMKLNNDCDSMQATADDPRKTKFGNFLRKTNLDEFPQFINVWKGEMSLVGPRPHMLKHTEMYSSLINKYMVRHLVKPGITGWAQVTGFRGETKELSQMEGRVKRDIWYIENWSFLLDIRIIIKTMINVVQGDKNAY